MPSSHGSPLEAALSYYNTVVMLNAEGDSMVTEDTLEGLGTTGFLLQALFGSILRLAQPIPPQQSPYLNPTSDGAGSSSDPVASTTTTTSTSQPDPTTRQRQPQISSQLKPPLPLADDDSNSNQSYTATSRGRIPATQYSQPADNSISSIAATAASMAQQDAGSRAPFTNPSGTADEHDGGEVEFLSIHDHDPDPNSTLYSSDLVLDGDEYETEEEEATFGLTQYLPEPGYFVAGAVAGGVSRTATAPLDRIKVALLVATGAKNGNTGAKSITSAVHELYKAGGLRTFFAGESSSHN